jgi:hypothetical protein
MSVDQLVSNPTVLKELSDALNVSSVGYKYLVQTAASYLQLDNANDAFYCVGANAATTFNLPVTSAFGKTYYFINDIKQQSFGKIIISQNTGQTIVLGTGSSTIGTDGYLWCLHRGSSFQLVCTDQTGQGISWMALTTPPANDTSPTTAFQLV